MSDWAGHSVVFAEDYFILPRYAFRIVWLRKRLLKYRSNWSSFVERGQLNRW